MSKNIPTLTVVIPSHNEEQTISRILGELTKQTQKNYLLEKIVVVCDGCSDNTALVAKIFQKKWTKIIEVLDDGKRLGKAARLQEQFQRSQSELLICCDADITLLKNNCIDILVSHQQKSGASLSVPSAVVVQARSFIQKSIRAYEHFWKTVITSVNKGQNIHTCLGCFMLLSKEFYQEVKFPPKVVAEDHYLYFSVKKNKLMYSYCATAQIGFQVANTISDYITQSLRYLGSSIAYSQFEETIVEHEYAVPVNIKVRAYALTLFREPLYFLSALVLQLIVRWHQVTQTYHISPTWDNISTTKRSP